MNKERPLILISNDDSVRAPGIRALVEYVADMADVIVAAPDSPQSGQSSAISVEKPLFITVHDDIAGARIYSINGTPVDCIKLAMHAIVPRKPDIVLSGINHGANSGNSIIYSGTMGAVTEACFLGIPSIGFSLLNHSWDADFSQCRPIIRHIVTKVLTYADTMPSDICLNVNIPARCTPKGIKVVRAARGYWTDEYAEYKTPHGKPYYWLTGKFINTDLNDSTTDEYWLQHEFATVVPVRPDQSAIDALTAIDTLLTDSE